MISLSWVEKYIGRTDLHCWGLVREVYKNEAQLPLPEYGEVDHKQLLAVAEAVRTESSINDTWKSVRFDQAHSLDVILMRGWLKCPDGTRRRGEVHVGVCTQKGYLLHTDMRDIVVHVPLSHLSVRNRLVGVYRHRVWDEL